MLGNVELGRSGKSSHSPLPSKVKGSDSMYPTILDSFSVEVSASQCFGSRQLTSLEATNRDLTGEFKSLTINGKQGLPGLFQPVMRF